MPTGGERTRRRAGRYAVFGLFGLLGLTGAVLLVWLGPRALYGYVPDPKDRAAAEASTRTGLIAGLAGLGALGSLAITARTYRLTEQGHITDRYTKAIEQLGSAKLDVRLGGVYALERIAVDSSRDHPTVVEVLSAFIREHGDSEPAAEPQPAVAVKKRHGLAADIPKKPKPAADIQAALTVLGRLPKRPDVSRGDLAHAQLAGAVLTGDLTGALLYMADLTGAKFELTNLTGARLNDADLTGAHFGAADLTGTYGLTQAQLDTAGSSLRIARLDQARRGRERPPHHPRR